jgi:hypothetical protein
MILFKVLNFKTFNDMRKITLLFLAASVGLMVISCQSTNEPKTTTEEVKTEEMSVPSIEEATVVNEAPTLDSNSTAPQREGGAQ